MYQKGWGDRVSEHCGLLDYLLPGDQIFTDCGFNVQESVGLYCAAMKVLAYTRGKKQVSSVELGSARKLSRVRIYVERVIGVLKQKYTIFQSIVPISSIMCDSATELSFIDNYSCCGMLCFM